MRSIQPINLPRWPRPLRDGLIAGGVVALLYVLVFAALLARSELLEPSHAAIQVVMQVCGFAVLVGLGSWFVRRAW